MNHTRRHNGFTLIELIVVVGVILVISVATLLNYNSYTDRQKVRQAGFSLRSDLRLAQVKATAGQKPFVCTEETTLEGYDVSFTVDCGDGISCYTIQPVCSSGGVNVDTTDEITRVSLPSTVVFAGNYPTIRFFTVTGITDLSDDELIVLTGAGVTYTVRVTPSGVVSDY